MKKDNKIKILTVFLPGAIKKRIAPQLIDTQTRNEKIIDVLYSCKTEEQLNNAFEWALKVVVKGLNYSSTNSWIESIYNDRKKVVI